jgi:hypothetical protein
LWPMPFAGIAANDAPAKTAVSPTVRISFFTFDHLLSGSGRKVRTDKCAHDPAIYADNVVF